MSRDFIDCVICEREFTVDHDDDPIDVCPRCADRISRIADQRVSTERHRLRTALLSAAKGLGGSARAAVETIAEALNEA